MSQPVELNYKQIEGIMYPEIQNSNNKEADETPLGKYGQMALSYLKENHPHRYSYLLMEGELLPIMHKVNEEAFKLSRRELAKRIGYVAQRNENIRTTVFDAVLLGRKPYIQWEASKNDLEIVHDALLALDLTEYALRYLNELSGGEQQKVVIARALVQKPELLLLDEPTSSLDLKNQLEVAKIIKKVVKEQQMAAVVTMHDLNLAIRFADKFLLIKNGEIFAAGGIEVMTTENIENVYSVPVTINKIGEIPVVIPV